MTPGEKIYENTESSGSKIMIRYLDKGDTHILQEYINELSLEQTFVRFQGEQMSFDEENAYVESQLKTIASGKSIVLLLFVDGKLAGVTNLSMMAKTESHVGLFGISIGKNYRGKGLGELLMENLINEATDSIPSLKIIILTVFDINDAAIHLYNKLGFVEHGRLPEGLFYKGNYVDQIEMHKKVR